MARRGTLLIASLSIAAVAFLATGSLPARAGAINFSRDVRPILSDKCFACHGPEAASRKAGFRLDERESAVGAAESGMTPITPGDPDASELIARITSEDESVRMPPTNSHKSLTPEEIETLRRWIAEGAEWQAHWSFTPPVKHDPPAVAHEHWPRETLDKFILARLEREQLAPAVEADRVTLLRRVTLDLTGLPPTPAEMDDFLADNRPDAYERAVDRLLASPRFGEHMARFWLDAARYGDTHGLHLDNYREMWPYRDWVVRAFNRNLPFNEFIVEQLAGDLLPSPTDEQLIATGFNRCHVSTNEGGVIPEEVYVTAVVDRVETFGTVMLGLTVGCTRCHDHKYDPLTQGDFYSLFAYFNSLDGNEMDGNREDPAPVIRAPLPEQTARLAELDQQIAAAETKLAADWPELDAQQADWERQFVSAVEPENVGGSGSPPEAVAANSKDYLAVSEWHWVGPFSDPERYLKSKKHGPEGAERIDLAEKFKLATGEEVGWVRKPEWVDGQVHNDLPGDPAANFLFRTITVGKPQDLEISLGSDDGIRVYLNNELLLQRDDSRSAAADQEKLVLKLKRGENRLLVKILNFAGQSGFYFAVKTDQPIMPPDVLAAASRHAAERSADDAKLVRQFFRNTAARSAALDQLRTELAAVRKERTDVDTAVATTLIFKEMATPKPSYILNRGEYDQHGAEVTRRTPTMLPPMEAAAPNNRLGLAQWLVSPANPLPARVAVNRFWQQFFGVGLVKTTNDFGAQGEAPSHPELLDWLAVDFMEHGWDVKRLVRELVVSAAYRQTSHVSPELYMRDPENRLLARGARFRLDAEMLRDQALYSSGLLVEKMGGPSVKPPQPAGLWEAVGYSGSNTVKFVADEGHEKVHRRTLYTFIKRTAPPPEMNTFDAPSRESCIVRRERTNTPLQALLLLNDPQYVEAARSLAERTMHEGGDSVEQRARFLFQTATCRQPRVDELSDLVAAYEQELEHFRANAKAAEELIASGSLKADEKLDRPELAAWTMAANVVLNLDEVVTRN
ncbi:PSD1 and planctomycete cytochrome C domain-containing protein [Lacipirellula limnantheis]|uniref:Planctomycete cytochrome C n=1 Tax=Lacipirellula limnantheis TaxID=2528024 RepID=A0A517U2E3_9BACT|nr:PSD1 and planctomycete cytochrome C domain-containing protein [Lacipirellula limnantheis]QDT74791.1 Planctomycete cytochrome C [Lacipirellula limnantheis]